MKKVIGLFIVALILTSCIHIKRQVPEAWLKEYAYETLQEEIFSDDDGFIVITEEEAFYYEEGQKLERWYSENTNAIIYRLEITHIVAMADGSDIMVDLIASIITIHNRFGPDAQIPEKSINDYDYDYYFIERN